MLHVLVVETDQGLCPIRGEVLGLFGDLGAPLRADVFPSDSAQSSVSLVRPVWTAMADAGMPAPLLFVDSLYQYKHSFNHL